MSRIYVGLGIAIAAVAIMAVWEFSLEPLFFHHWRETHESKWHFAFFGMGAATFALIFPLASLYRSNKARTAAERALQEMCDNLEERVHERTEAYERLNVQLKQEMDDHATSATLLREVTENINELFWVSSPDCDRMFYVSPAYADIWGLPPGNLYDRPMSFLEAVHPDDRGAAPTESARRKAVVDQTYRIRRADGAWRWIRDRSFPVVGADGTITRVVGIAEDITEIKLLQENLTRSQRLEAVGTLAGGIAHDFNNLLATVQVSAGALRRKTQTLPECERDIGAINYACRQGAALVKNLLRFARKEQAVRQQIPLATLIDDTVMVARSTFDRSIGIRSDIALDLEPIDGDPSQIHQVLMNLLLNARDAINSKGGGVLTVSARNVMLDPETARCIPGLRSGRYVEVAVADTGCGIPADVQKHVFDPFFTTKEPGQGLGLGLATVHGIVTGHGGAITFQSTEGVGTTFRIHLPVATSGAAAPYRETVHDAGMPAPAPAHILVVDDEERLCRSIAAHLAQAGHHMDVAFDGAAALERLAAGTPFDLMILDMMMPGMSGWEVLRHVASATPDLPVLIMSGYADDERLAETQALGYNRRIDKPFELAELDAAVAAALEPHTPPRSRTRREA